MLQTLRDIGPQALAQITAPRGGARLRLSLDSSMIDDLKRLFMRFAREVDPGFRVTADNRGPIRDIFNWCIANRAGRLDPAKGLWLYGNVGTGKTTLLEVVKKFCREIRAPKADNRPYSFAIVKISDVVTAYSKNSYEGLNRYADNPSIAYDDVGTENTENMHFGNCENLMQYILQRRYGRDLITHATSNIGKEQIRKVYKDRVYDRCCEMFNFIPMIGKSFRQK